MTKKKLREKSFFLRQLIKDKNVKEKKIIENLKSIIPTNNEIISGFYPVIHTSCLKNSNWKLD